MLIDFVEVVSLTLAVKGFYLGFNQRPSWLTGDLRRASGIANRQISFQRPLLVRTTISSTALPTEPKAPFTYLDT